MKITPYNSTDEVALSLFSEDGTSQQSYIYNSSLNEKDLVLSAYSNILPPVSETLAMRVKGLISHLIPSNQACMNCF